MYLKVASHFGTIKFISISVLAGLMGVVFLPVLAHSMRDVEFSSFSKLLLYAQMAATPSMFGFSAYLTTLVANLDSANDAIKRAYTDWLFLLAIFTTLILFGVVAAGFPLSLIFLLLVSYARAFQTVGAQSCRLLSSPAGFALYQIVIPASFYVVAVLCARSFRLSGSVIFYIASATYVLASFYTYKQFCRRDWVDKLWVGAFRNARFVRFALGAFMHSLAGLAVTSWDKIYTASMLDPKTFAIYIIGAQYAGGLVLVYTSISQALIPQMYLLLAEKEGGAFAFGKFALALAAGFVLLFFLFEMAVGPLMRLVFPVHFYSAVSIAQLLGVAALLQGLYFISSAILFYYLRTFSLAAITISCGTGGVIISTFTGASSVTAVATIAILVWGAFFALTALYSAILLIKK